MMTEQEKFELILESIDETKYDVDAMEIDFHNNNFNPEELYTYECRYIVRMSILNGQIAQAKKQCDRYGLELMEIKLTMDEAL